MKMIILYPRFLDPFGKRLTVGGIQTYIMNLAQLATKLQVEPIIMQYAEKRFETEYNGIPIYGIPCSKLSVNKAKHRLFDEALKLLDRTRDLLIFASDNCAVKNDLKNTLLIQHGYPYDLPNKFLTGYPILCHGIPGILKKFQLKYRAYRYFTCCRNRVCVDYNFINVYRTIVPGGIEGKIWVIPNFAKIVPEKDIANKIEINRIQKIIFARRFEEYRGTRIMATAVKKLLVKHPDIEMTFAGEGPDEQLLKAAFSDEKRVTFIKYRPEDSTQIHTRHDVSIIPSLASEGTSLSVAEAMGAGCLTIASNVGGITNMIIDHFNGFLIEPSSQQLYQIISKIVSEPKRAQRIRKNGYHTAKAVFSHSRWEKEWERVIHSFCQ